eukprot:scaffold37945_cov33-Tisochrysis_lutea.AAC.3
MAYQDYSLWLGVGGSGWWFSKDPRTASKFNHIFAWQGLKCEVLQPGQLSVERAWMYMDALRSY